MFTHKEKTTKSHTVADAVKAAECILSTRRIKKLNVTSLAGRSHDDPITIAEVNVIADSLVSDTLYA